MSITKVDLANAALEELRISGITVNPNNRDVKSAIIKLDTLMTNWERENICLGYNKPLSYGGSLPNDESGIPAHAEHAVIANLAKSLCASHGKQCNIETLKEAKQGKNNLYDVTLPQRDPNPIMPVGSGASYRYYGTSYFCKYQPNTEQAPDNCSTLDIKVGQTAEYNINFSESIPVDNTISSIEVEDSAGLTVVDSSFDGGIVTLKCTGVTQGFFVVKVTLNYDPSALTEPFAVNFNVAEV